MFTFRDYIRLFSDHQNTSQKQNWHRDRHRPMPARHCILRKLREICYAVHESKTEDQDISSPACRHAFSLSEKTRDKYAQQVVFKSNIRL